MKTKVNEANSTVAAEVSGLKPTSILNAIPSNCTEVNGYWVCEYNQQFNLYDPAQKCWFGFNFDNRASAERACNALAGN